MNDLSQISADISATTKEKLDRFTDQHGLKKNFVIEQALLFFIEARRQLPDEAFIPTRILLEDEGFDEFVNIFERPPVPTAALAELLGNGED